MYQCSPRTLSVAMLSFKRPDNLGQIVRSLRENALVDDIVIWHNNPDEPPPAFPAAARIKVVSSNHDAGMSSRWYASLLAEHDRVLVQDDDLLLSDRAIQTLCAEWEREPSIIHGIWGGVPDETCSYTMDRCYPEAEYVLTRAMVFRKRYVHDALRALEDADEQLRRLLRRNGEDIFMSYLVMSRARRRNRTHMLTQEVTELPSEFAIWRRPGHVQERTQVLRACREMFRIAGRPGAARC